MAGADDTTIYNHLRRMLCAGALSGAPDEELLKQFVARRDEAAFAVLLRRHGPMVWGVCRRLLTHSEDAEDAFQATFLLLARKAASIARPQLLANWLFGVARRSALSVRARQARRARRERSCGNVPEVGATPPPPWDDLRAVLDEELGRLPAKYRLPMLLCALEGMTQAEAGKSLGWPTGTVSARLSRGRELLRTRLRRRGVTALTTALAAAGPPPQVVAAVRNAAAVVAAGKAAAAGVPPAVGVLMDAVLRTTALSRWLTVTTLLAALALTLAGVGMIWHLSRPAGAPPSVPGELAHEQSSPAAGVRPAPPDRPAAPLPARPPFPLPPDPNAVVLRIERSVDSATAPGMALTVHADGRVVAEVPEGLWSLAPGDLTSYAQDQGNAQDADAEPPKVTTLEGKLSARQLEELLQFAVHDQEFFDFDPDTVKAAIREEYDSDGDVSDANDTTTTTFRVQTADETHEVRWPRLARSAWDYPDVERLLQLYAVDRRLQQVFYVLVAGGPERVEAAAEKMNQLVQPYYHLYPLAPRLTAADLFRVTPSGDGTRMQFTFSRNRDKTVRNPLFEVSIDVPRQGEPTIVYVMPPVR